MAGIHYHRRFKTHLENVNGDRQRQTWIAYAAKLRTGLDGQSRVHFRDLLVWGFNFLGKYWNSDKHLLPFHFQIIRHPKNFQVSLSLIIQNKYPRQHSPLPL